ncbi:MAG: hypothetical protein K1X66_02300 [Verrucomicrobiae bacterium]|nr:hypothetical protein [Verrucomicrobiae bacterium]
MKRDKTISFKSYKELDRLLKVLAKIQKLTLSTWLEKKIIEVLSFGSNTIAPVESGFQNLWLNPKGKVYHVPSMGHGIYSIKLCNCSPFDLINKRGWCALAFNQWFFSKKITKAQFNFITDWCTTNKVDLPKDIPLADNANLRS